MYKETNIYICCIMGIYVKNLVLLFLFQNKYLYKLRGYELSITM